MESRVTYRRRFSDGKPIDFYTEHSFFSSDGILGKRTRMEHPNVYVRDRRRIRFDSSDWKVVAANLLSQWRSKRNHNATSDLQGALMQRKAETLGFGKEKPVDFHTRISSRSSGVDNSHNITFVLPAGLMGGKRKIEEVEAKVMSQSSEEKPVDSLTKISSLSSDGISRKKTPKESPNPYVRPRRNCTQGSRSSNQKVVSAICSGRQSKKVCKSTSVLRQPIYNFLFDHCFRNLWRESPEARRNPFTYMNCFCFYMYTKEHNRKKVLSLIKKENIFSKRYVFVPILLWSHWSLLIFCHLGESLDSKTTTPCMLLLDSLHTYGAPPKLEPLIRRLVLDIFENEGRPESKDMVEKIPLLVPKVPQQRNDKECGIFVLYYLNLFLESAPESFSISNGYPYFLKEDWFTEEELEGFYERLESLGLECSDSEEGLESSDSEGTTIERLVGDTWKICGK